jgi:hypothetical protein
MINENEFDYVDMTEAEELAEQALDDAMDHAKMTLQLSERCFLKFGKRLLSDTQKAYFEKLAGGTLPDDEEQAAMEREQITLDMQAVVLAREAAKQKAAQQGEAYEPELLFQDRTDSSVN